MEENVIQINGGITINVDVSVKSVMYVKKLCKYLASIMDDSTITSDEIIQRVIRRRRGRIS